MRPADLAAFALASLTHPHPACMEACYRRAISACYYAVFHRLAEAGAEVFSGAGTLTSRQARRAFKHSEMKAVCAKYRAWAPGRPLAPPLNILVSGPPDPRLLNVATSFVLLQELRENADYDLSRAVSLQDATEAYELAYQALTDLDAIADAPATRTFLAALMMADRWTKRG